MCFCPVAVSTMPSLQAHFTKPNMPTDINIEVDDTTGRLQLRASYEQVEYFRIPKEFKAEDFNNDTLQWYIKHEALHIKRADGTEELLLPTQEWCDYKYPVDITIENLDLADTDDDSDAESDTTEHSQPVRIIEKNE